MGPLMLPWTLPPHLPLLSNPFALHLLKRSTRPPHQRLFSGHEPGKIKSQAIFSTRPSVDISATCTAVALPQTYERVQLACNFRPTWSCTSRTSSTSWTPCAMDLSVGRTLKPYVRFLGSPQWPRGGTAWSGSPLTSLSHTALVHP